MEMMAMKMVMAMVMLMVSGVACATRLNSSSSAAIARWIVSKSDWGVLSTISTDLEMKGMPWGNVASVSDGPVGNSTGIPYFYLSKLDPTPIDIDTNSSCSLTLSEAPLGSCSKLDAENPNCARLTLSGKLEEVTNTTGRAFAKDALWTRHPEMEHWPEEHKWEFYKLTIADIFFLNGYGGKKPITVDEYYQVSFEPAVAR